MLLRIAASLTAVVSSSSCICDSFVTKGINLTSKRLQREEYWWCTVFPYCLNDNVKGLGNVSSKIDDSLVVYAKFERKYKRRPAFRKKGKIGIDKIGVTLRNMLHEYVS